MQRLIGFLCLIVCLFMTVSTAVAQEPLPDLTPIVVDANQGSLEVRNIGNEAAKPSQLYVVCSMFHAGQRSTPCAAGLHLPGYIAKWNALPFDIPALKPGESYHIQLFGAGAFQKKTENVYGMQITTDPLKRIAESNEANNYTRLDVAPKPGVLRLVGQDDLPELPVYYLIRRHGKSAGKSQPIRGTRSIKALPLDFYLGPGSYDVRVVQQRSIYSTGDLDKMVIGEWLLVNSSGVLVGSKEIVELKLIFRQEPPGKLKLHLLADGHPTGAWTGIATLEGDKIQPKLMRRNLEADTELNLLPGRYEVLATPKDEGPYSRKHGYGTQQVSFEIRSGQTTDKTLRFVSARKGKLVLSALVDGGRNKADIKIRHAGSKETFGYVDTSYNLFSNSVELVPGNYDISVLPLEYTLSPGGVDVFHGGVEAPGIKTKRIHGVEPIILHNIEIRPGATLKKSVNFEYQK